VVSDVASAGKAVTYVDLPAPVRVELREGVVDVIHLVLVPLLERMEIRADGRHGHRLLLFGGARARGVFELRSHGVEEEDGRHALAHLLVADDLAHQLAVGQAAHARDLSGPDDEDRLNPRQVGEQNGQKGDRAEHHGRARPELPGEGAGEREQEDADVERREEEVHAQEKDVQLRATVLGPVEAHHLHAGRRGEGGGVVTNRAMTRQLCSP